MRTGPLIIVLGATSFLTPAAQVKSSGGVPFVSPPKAPAKANNLLPDGNVGKANK